jgi:hypothetical protein
MSSRTKVTKEKLDDRKAEILTLLSDWKRYVNFTIESKHSLHRDSVASIDTSKTFNEKEWDFGVMHDLDQWGDELIGEFQIQVTVSNEFN